MTTPSDVLRIAAREIGYQAGYRAGSKYGQWAAQRTGKAWMGAKGVPFCDLFVSWAFETAGAGEAIGVEPGKVYAYTPYHLAWFKARGRVIPVSRAEPGDVVFFDWHAGGDPVEHVGIVERNLGSGALQTIEGNTTRGIAGSQANGGGVWRRVRTSGIKAVCRPAWKPSTPIGEEEPEMFIMKLTTNNDHFLVNGVHRHKLTSLTLAQKLTASGVKVIDVTPEELAFFPEPAQDVWGYKNPATSAGNMDCFALMRKAAGTE